MERLLVVNNDFDTMLLLKKYLEKYNYEVCFSGNRKEVIHYVEKFTPDLLIVDIMQQKVIRDLKNNPLTFSVPVLMMTGYTERYANSELAVDDTIEKPFDLILLRDKIEVLTSIRNIEKVPA